MIPLRLELSNFLSYATPACLEFDAIHLACISGPNGAGKSTILDALTWALFGRSRFPARNEDDLVNRLARARGEAVEVRFTFRLEDVDYRVIRRKEVGKTAMLEFQIGSGDGQWRSMSEGRLRDTQAMIEQLLRMNFDTFINASFFLQGKADEFTTKTPNRRKEILAELLGVTIWDGYKESAAASRREADGELQRYQVQLDEIDRELAEEPQRREAVDHARQSLAEVAARLELQEKLLVEIRRTEEAVKRQQQLVKSQEEGVSRGRHQLARLQQSLDQRRQEHADLQAMLGRSGQIQANFAAFEAAREQAESWQARADEHHGLLQQIRPHELAYERARATLAQRLEELENQARKLAESQAQRPEIEKWLQEAADAAEAGAGRLADLAEAEGSLNQARAEHDALQAEQGRLDQEMRKMRERIDRLEEDPTGACPLCGQELTAHHRDEVIAELGRDGRALADRYRQNKARLAELNDLTARLGPTVKDRPRLEAELRAQQKRVADLEARLREMDATAADWDRPVGGRLAPAEEKRQLAVRLAEGDVEPQAQAVLAELRERLSAIGYDAAAHQEARGRLRALAAAPAERQQLEAAAGQAALLADTLEDLERQVAEQAENLRAQEGQLQAAQTELDELAAGRADARAIEDDAIRLREEKDAATRRLGAAQQQLEVLSDLRLERQRLCETIEEQRLLIRRLRILEKSCGPDGVPALLIEHARPEIEAEANELLDRLTGGRMTIRLETQKALKTRDHLAETLDIFVGDEVGERPYESFSGGEQFRINFAIRLALSKLLAKRAGARLQTLVIDEGFGSQDPDGRRRLVEAINVVQHDFELILVITHIEELRDAFPSRIEVEKGPRGSTVAIVH